MSDTHNNQVNDTRKSDLMKEVGKFGREAGLGKDSLPKLAHAVVKAAADGVIEASETEAIFKHYTKEEGAKLIHERSEGGKKSNISKLRQLINMGAMTTIDAVTVMQDAKDVLDDLKENSKEGLKPAYAYYVDVARAQLKLDRELSKENLADIAIKAGPAEKTVEGELKSILKKLEDLVTGEGKHGLKDEHEDTEAAFHLIKSRVDAIATLRAQDDLRKKAAALGMTLA